MARNVPGALITALSQPHVKPYFAVELNYDSGDVRFWTGVGNKIINGDTYTGVGSLLSISDFEEVTDLAARGITISLSGIDSTLVSVVLTEPYQGRECKVYFGVEGVNPVQVFSGIMDVMTIFDSGDTSTIIVTVESKLISLDRVVPFRYTNSFQREKYSTDTFFRYITKLQDKEILWGRSK